MGFGGNQQSARQDNEVNQQQQDVADQTEFFAIYGKNEVGRGLGNVIQMRLCAVEPAFPPDTAGTDGNHGLDDVVACAQRVLRRVKQRQDAGFLIVVHPVVPQKRQCGNEGDDSGKDDFPRQTCEKDDENTRCHNQNRRTQVGLFQNQRNGDED